MKVTRTTVRKYPIFEALMLYLSGPLSYSPQVNFWSKGLKLYLMNVGLQPQTHNVMN